MCRSDQRAETICFLAMSVFCQISLFTQPTLLFQNFYSLKLKQGSCRSTWLGPGRHLLPAGTGQGTPKSTTGAGVPVIRVERKCPSENEAGCALYPSHQNAKLKFSVAFICTNSKTTNCFVLLGFGFLHIPLHLVLKKHCSDSFP